VTRCGKPKDLIARAYYLKKLAEGKTKKQAKPVLKGSFAISSMP